MLSDQWGLVTVSLTIIGTVWSLAWWLSGKFSELRHLVYDQVEKLGKEITNKLEYHEKHDDQRFLSMGNDIWEMKVRNAAVKGIISKSKGPSTNLALDLKEHFREEAE
jgi:hypothetical protein